MRIILPQGDLKPLVTREKAFRDINETQEYYVNELIVMMEDEKHAAFKELNFTSATGTGKTKMMAMLINRFPDDYFIVTTQSRGQLHQQIRESLERDCPKGNFTVYGLMDYRVNSILTGEEIVNRIPTGARCFWLRDEGHIATNNYAKLLEDKCYKIINFSATNQRSDIRCNFTHTMMLRTVNQETGTPEDAIEALLRVKEVHKNIVGYNPCAIFRCVSAGSKIRDRIIKACEQYGLKYIDLNENNDYIMNELCEDDNEYDVIINKMKIIEGIDIRRAHVLYMDNQPSNETTTIQVIGRCRRNALLYRDDIDILAPENEALLKATRECYVFYNVKDMKVDSDENGELCYAFCPYISCQALKTGISIDVVNGQMANGLVVIELEGETGTYEIVKDSETGFNVVNPESDFYKKEMKKPKEHFYFEYIADHKRNCKKIQVDSFFSILDSLPLNHDRIRQTGVRINGYFIIDNVPASKKTRSENVELFKLLEEKYTKDFLIDQIRHVTLPYALNQIKDYYSDKMNSTSFLEDHKTKYAKDYRLLSESIGNFGRIPADREFLKYRSVHFFQHLKDLSSNDRIYAVKNALDITMNMIARVPTLNNADVDKIFCNYRRFDSYELCFSPEDVLSRLELPKLRSTMELYGKPYIYKQDIVDYFNRLDKCFSNIEFVYIGENLAQIAELILVRIHKTSDNLHNNIIERVKIDYTSHCQDLTETERRNQKPQITSTLSCADIKDILMHRHTTITNDRESAIIGTDLFKPKKKGSTTQWIEASTVSSKITSFNKLNTFLDEKYKVELASAEAQLFTGENNFSLDRRFNSMLGYCAEYYSKYLVYGKPFMKRYIRKAVGETKDGSSESNPSEMVIVRACILQYHAIMKECYGQEVARLIPSASISTLARPEAQEFIKLVVMFGTRAAKYVKATLYPNINGNAIADIDPILSMRHIAGLADYITKDTILDIKVTNYIDKRYIKQVLAYHYLSTKRNDVKIKRVIVYDATSDKAVEVPISSDNISMLESANHSAYSIKNWIW